MNIAVIYQSQYGATRQYAQWIAQELDAPLLDGARVKPRQLWDYDLVIYGGGLYASGIRGIKLVTHHPCKRLALFTVGLADPAATDYSPLLDKNIPARLRDSTPVFHLRGGMDYAQLSAPHRVMMSMMKKMLEKKPEAQRTQDDRDLLATYGQAVDFAHRDSIRPLVDWVRSLKQ